MSIPAGQLCAWCKKPIQHPDVRRWNTKYCDADCEQAAKIAKRKTGNEKGAKRSALAPTFTLAHTDHPKVVHHLTRIHGSSGTSIRIARAEGR